MEDGTTGWVVGREEEGVEKRFDGGIGIRGTYTVKRRGAIGHEKSWARLF